MDSPSRQTLFDRVGGRERLRQLVQHFYADVHQHAFISPVFEKRINDWPSHIEKITDFWSGVTGGPATYCGPMPLKHLPLGIDEQHFEAWLGLWKRNCLIHLPDPEAGELAQAAEMIGQRLRQIIARHESGDSLI